MIQRDQLWKDSLKFNIEKAVTFYDCRRFKEPHGQIWREALNEYSQEKITQAFNEHYKVSGYMPRPSDIIKLINTVVTPAHQDTSQKDKPEKLCDPIVHVAWVKYHREYLHSPFATPAFHRHQDEPPKLREWRDAVEHHYQHMTPPQALDIVNRESASRDNVGAIRPDHRIPSFWAGKQYDPDEWWRNNTNFFETSEGREYLAKKRN